MVGICCTPPCAFVHPPYICMPHMFIHPPYIHIAPQGCTHPPGAPHVSVLLHGFGTLPVVGGCFSVLCVLGHTTPIWGCFPLFTPPTLHCWFSVHCYSQGYQFLCGPFSPSVEGFGGVPPSLGEVGVTLQ